MGRVRIVEGALEIDGKPFFCLAGDYPYYRDHPGNWADRLGKMREMGLNTVTCYIPWRHHAPASPAGPYDFTGATDPRRDVRGFLAAAGAAGLRAIVKPGPFIHAETNFGGLPDQVSPERNPRIQAMTDGRGRPRLWASEGRRPRQPEVLPAPLDPVFLGLVREWYGGVAAEILAPFGHPRGPVIGVQLCNEGIYSDGWRAPWDADHSPSALGLFRRMLEEEYAGIDVYNRLHETAYKAFHEIRPPDPDRRAAGRGELLARLDWGRFQAYFLREVYTVYRGFLHTELPVMANINPLWEAPDGSNPQKYEWWLGRIVPESWPGVAYGFTNWIGAVSYRPESLSRYMMLVKRARGINLEENWAYVGDLHQKDPIGDQLFATPAVSAFQTLLAVALGGTGYTIYTAVETACWDTGLDTRRGTHPGDAPLRADGGLSRKYRVARLLNGFFAQEGPDLLGAQSDARIAYGVSPGAAGLSAWLRRPKDWRLDDLGLIRSGYQGLDDFQALMLQRNLDYRLVNVEEAGAGMGDLDVLCLRGPARLDRGAQERLAAFCRDGGILVLDGPQIGFDAALHPCDALTAQAEPAGSAEGGVAVRPLGAGWLLHYPGGGAFAPRGGFLERLPPALAPAREYPPGLRVWCRTNRRADKTYYFCFNFGAEAVTEPFTRDGAQLRVVLPPKGCAVFAVQGGRLQVGFALGVHEHEGAAMAPAVEAGRERFRAPAPGDVFFTRRGEGYEIRTEGP